MMKPIFVWQNKVLKKIHPEDVICLSTEENYTRIYLADQSHYMVRSTLDGALKKLPGEIFIKVHRSFAVSLLYIDTIHKDHVEIGVQPIPVGRLYYKKFINKLDIIE